MQLYVSVINYYLLLVWLSEEGNQTPHEKFSSHGMLKTLRIRKLV